MAKRVDDARALRSFTPMPASGVRTALGDGLFRADALSATRLIASDGVTEQLVAVMHGPWGFRHPVFLKRLVPQAGPLNEAGARALATEAMVLGRISHPAVACLHDFRRVHGRLTLVLERVDGVTPARLLGDPTRALLLSPEARLFLVHRLFDALAALHEAVDPRTGTPSPVVHGGVGLRSLLIPRDGYARLVDFGYASFAPLVARTTRPSSTRRERAPTPPGGAATASDVHAACVVARQLLPAPHVFSAALEDAIGAGLSFHSVGSAATARTIADVARASLASSVGRTALSDAVNGMGLRRRDSRCDDDITVRAPYGSEQDETPTKVIARPPERS